MSNQSEQKPRHQGIETLWFYRRLNQCYALHIPMDIHEIGFIMLMDGLAYRHKEILHLENSPSALRIDKIALKVILKKLITSRARFYEDRFRNYREEEAGLYRNLASVKHDAGLIEDDPSFIVKTFNCSRDLEVFLNELYDQYSIKQAQIYAKDKKDEEKTKTS